MLKARLNFIVSYYISLEHGMTVDAAVCKIFEHSDTVCATIIANASRESVEAQDSNKNDSDDNVTSTTVAAQIQKRPHVLAAVKNHEMFISLTAAAVLPLPAKTNNTKANDEASSLELWYLALGLSRFLESFSRARLEATARAFGLDAAEVSAGSRAALMKFVVLVALDDGYHSVCNQAAADGAKAGGVSVAAADVDAPEVITPSDPPKAKKQRTKTKNQQPTTTAATATPTTVASPAPKREREDDDEADSTTTNNKAKKSSKKVKSKVVPALFSSITNATETTTTPPTIAELCRSEGRDLDPAIFNGMPQSTAMRLLTEPARIPTKELAEIRPDISKDSTEWTLTQWYNISDLDAYCKSNGIHLKSKDKNKKGFTAAILASLGKGKARSPSVSMPSPATSENTGVAAVIAE